jgi:hypothetical protein
MANLLEEGEMLATHQSNRKINHSSRKIWWQDGNLLEEGKRC